MPRPLDLGHMALGLVLLAAIAATGCGGSSGAPAAPSAPLPTSTPPPTASASIGEASDTQVPDLRTPRALARATPAPVRGESATPPTTSPAPSPGEWLRLAPLGLGARQETAVVAHEGEVWVLGGFDGDGRVVARVEIYDPASDAWRVGPDLPVPMHHANAASAGGAVIVAGFLEGRSFAPSGRVFVYDEASDAWTERRSMPEGRERGGSGVAVLGGMVYVAGGLRAGAVDDFSVYDPASDRWQTLPDAPVRSDHLVAGAIDGVVYIAGGRSGRIDAHRPRLDAYDPSAREWSPRAPMPTSRGGIGGAVLSGKLYVFGGEGNPEDASGVFGDAEVYDPATDSWQILPPMPTPRHGTGAAAVGGAIFVPGGATRAGFGAVDTHEAFAVD